MYQSKFAEDFYTYDLKRRASTAEKKKRNQKLYYNQSEFTYDSTYSQQLKDVTAQSQKLRISLLHERQKLLKYHGPNTPYTPQKTRISIVQQQSESPKNELSIRKKQTLLRKLENELKKSDPHFNIMKYLKSDKQLLFQPTKKIPAYSSPKKKQNYLLLEYYKSKQTANEQPQLEVGEARRIKWAMIKEKRKTFAAKQIKDPLDKSLIIRKLQIKTDEPDNSQDDREKKDNLKRQKSPLSFLFWKYKDEVQQLYNGSSDQMKNLIDFYQKKPETYNKFKNKPKTEESKKRQRTFSLYDHGSKRLNSTCLNDSQFMLLDDMKNSLRKQGQKIDRELKKNVFINLKLRQENSMLQGPPNLNDQITVRKFIKGPNYLCEIVRLMNKDDPNRNLKEYEFLYDRQNFSSLPDSEQKFIQKQVKDDEFDSLLQI